MTSTPARIICIGLNVADLAASTHFYCSAFDCVPVGHPITAGAKDRHRFGTTFVRQRLRLGTQEIELTAFPRSTPYPTDSSAADLWFQHMAIVTTNIDKAYARLQQLGSVPISIGGPQTLPATSGGVTAYKFRDPDSHPLELISFPTPTGTIRTGLPLITGIDHSAISVADTERSRRFYQRVLGFPAYGSQCNQGPAQARLDGLDPVITDVTALGAADAPPHLELLAYRVPRGRARQPPKTLTTIAATRLVVHVGAVTQAVGHARLRGGLVPVADADFAVIRDPDGHILVLVTETSYPA